MLLVDLLLALTLLHRVQGWVRRHRFAWNAFWLVLANLEQVMTHGAVITADDGQRWETPPVALLFEAAFRLYREETGL